MVKKYQETANFVSGVLDVTELQNISPFMSKPQKFSIQRVLVLSDADYQLFVNDDFRRPPVVIRAKQRYMGFDVKKKAWMAISTSTIPTYSLWAAPAPARPGRMQFPMCWKLAVPWSSQIPKEKFCARLAAFSNERDMKYGCSICSTRMRPSAITHSGMCGMTKRCCS